MADDLRAVLAAYLRPNPVPGGPGHDTISEAGIMHWAAHQGISLREAMVQCLAREVWPERLCRNRGTLSAADQARLLQARVAVIGAGGLGGLAVLELARLGVGGLNICDADVFEESNLNRQMLCDLSRLGINKALCAHDAVRAISPATQVRVFDFRAEPATLPGILEGCHLALDCLDNMAARYDLEAAAREAGIPYVHGALAGAEGLVMTVAPGEPGLRGLYGPTPAAKAEGAESSLGVPTPTPAAVATLQVGEAMGLLLGRRRLGPGQLLHLDLAAPSLEVMGG